MIQVKASVNINRPTSDVFAFISNFANNPKWQSGMREVYFTTEPPIRLGSEFTQIARFLGRTIESTFKVIAYEPGRLIKATTLTSFFPITFTRTVAPSQFGSNVTEIVQGDAGGLFKLAEPLMQKKVQSAIDKDYIKLKELLES